MPTALGAFLPRVSRTHAVTTEGGADWMGKAWQEMREEARGQQRNGPPAEGIECHKLTSLSLSGARPLHTLGSKPNTPAVGKLLPK